MGRLVKKQVKKRTHLDITAVCQVKLEMTNKIGEGFCYFIGFNK